MSLLNILKILSITIGLGTEHSNYVLEEAGEVENHRVFFNCPELHAGDI